MNGSYDPLRARLYRARLTGAPQPSRSGGLGVVSGPLGKVLGVVVGAVAVVAAMAMSVIALGAILVVAVVGGAWVWWRTRDLRRQLRDQMARMQSMAAAGASPAAGARAAGSRAVDGDVIDGDYIREAGGEAGSGVGSRPDSGSAGRSGPSG